MDDFPCVAFPTKDRRASSAARKSLPFNRGFPSEMIGTCSGHSDPVQVLKPVVFQRKLSPSPLNMLSGYYPGRRASRR